MTGVYGPGDPHASYGPNAFARSLARDRTVRIFGRGEEERDHVYVDDVGRADRGPARGAAPTGVFNVATGQSRSFADVVKAIRDLVPYEVAVTSAPRKGAITHRRFDTARPEPRAARVRASRRSGRASGPPSRPSERIAGG